MPGAAGDVLFFNYLTIHGSGVNASDEHAAERPLPVPGPGRPTVLREGVEDHVDWGEGADGRGIKPGVLGVAAPVPGQSRKNDGKSSAVKVLEFTHA